MVRRDPLKAPRKPGAGRDTGLTLTRLQAITNLLLGGNYVGTAAAFVGISLTTYHRWVERGETEMDRVSILPRVSVDQIMESFEGRDPSIQVPTKDGGSEAIQKASPEYMWTHRPAKFLATEWPFVVFQFQVQRAKAAAEIRMLNDIQAAGHSDWHAQAWSLERMYPEKYGRRERISLDGGAEGQPVKVESIITVDALNEKLAAVLNKKKK